MWDKVDRSEFNDYKREVWERHEASNARFGELERLIGEKTPDLISDVRQALADATDDQARARKAAEESEAILAILTKEQEELNTVLMPLKAELNKTETLNAQLKEKVDRCQLLQGELGAAKAKADSTLTDLSSTLEKARTLLEQTDDVPAQIENAAKLLTHCESLRDNIQGVVDHSISRKAALDEVHNEIFGQILKGSDGTSDRIEGLREKLKKSFDQADIALVALKDRATADVSSVTEQLKALMPGAMAAGLSAAYEAKTNSEIVTQQRLEKQFIWGIGGLALVSLIPFAVDVYLLAQGKELIEVIRQTPVLQILPLYFPVLWFAYSTNKKVNLSKRLIEEYTHKSVLGKTFSGLSNQIDALPKDHEVTQELRLRLLFNVLQVSAENPGKLITDYSKADHPVMEVLENSSKLSGSIDALQRLPGFSRLVELFSSRQAELTKAQAHKVVTGLDAAASLTKK